MRARTPPWQSGLITLAAAAAAVALAGATAYFSIRGMIVLFPGAPAVGTGTSSAQLSALRMARWWHCQQDTSSERTPFARMLPRVIGSNGA